jgi:hypothetical protein
MLDGAIAFKAPQGTCLEDHRFVIGADGKHRNV